MNYKRLNQNSYALWFIPKSASIKPISDEEILWKKTLSNYRSIEYEHSRGYLRETLSQIWDIPPLRIPLNAPPGKPPNLPKGMGFVSISHCIDSLLISWSMEKVGVDVERADRAFDAKKIMINFFSHKENILLNNYKGEELRKKVLKYWVSKEAAIKCQRGDIFKDMKNWIYSEINNTITNKVELKENFSFFINYKDWYISIASKNYLKDGLSIMCTY